MESIGTVHIIVPDTVLQQPTGTAMEDIKELVPETLVE